MRILLTGCTAIMADSPRKQTDIVTSMPCMKTALTENGHVVEWRGVTVGEDLSSFDLIIIALAPLGNWGTHYMGGCLWALMSHPNIRLTVDDWQTRGIHKSCQGLIAQDKYFQKVIWGHWKEKVDGSYEDVLRDGVRALANPFWPWPMLVPCWDGGDLRLLGLPAPLTRWDPTRYMRSYDHVGPPKTPENRVRAWVFASLTSKMDWLNKQNFHWPVAKYGNVREGQRKLEEVELVRVYRDTWGVISPPHNVSGAGWWRVRFWLAATSGCVVICDKDESRILGPAYRNEPRMLEQLPNENLARIADYQMECLDKVTWQKERVQQQLEEFINDRRICSDGGIQSFDLRNSRLYESNSPE